MLLLKPPILMHSCNLLWTLSFLFQNFFGSLFGNFKLPRFVQQNNLSCKDLCNKTQVSSGNFKLKRFVQHISSRSNKKNCDTKGKFHPQLIVRQQAWHSGDTKSLLVSWWFLAWHITHVETTLICWNTSRGWSRISVKGWLVEHYFDDVTKQK